MARKDDAAWDAVDADPEPETAWREADAATEQAAEDALPLSLPPGWRRRDLFVNRELSLLEFQRRVLEEAQDPSHPLLERVKFLSIVGSNLDEFFMVRVPGLKEQAAVGVGELPPDGLTPRDQLGEIRRVALELMEAARDTWHRDLAPALEAEGIVVRGWSELSTHQRAEMTGYFEDLIFPILTPLAVDPGRPFPHISNLSVNLAVLIRGIDGQERFARVKVPGQLPRLIPVGPRPAAARGGRAAAAPGPRRVETFVWVEDVIAANLDALFPGMTVLEAYPFHVTRDADMVIQELEAEDLLETIEQGVRARQFGSVTRLKVPPAMPARTRELLVENLEMDPRDVYVLDAPLALAGLMGFYGAMDRWDLKDVPFKPALPRVLEPQQDGEDGIFGAIRQGDILLHHPYDSFRPVVDFLRAAAQDPGVLAIKQTLYRVGRNSPVVEALLEAREEDKQVAVLVELKARFDEESNISWARKLEAEGTHVIYGLLGLKTHGKAALVVRREGKKLRRYVHLSTGNYNPVTANLYTDIGYFTCDPEIGEDVSDLFNYLTGYSAKRDYRKLLVAPINLRERIAERIEREIEHARRGERAELCFKVNALLDKQLILHLYRASQAGVKVDLLVRGICCLKPGVPGLSENIRVISTLGRFLEHSRILWFRNGGEEEVLLGSADLMPRNLDRRVEILFPVQDPRWVRYVRDEVLDVYLRDNVKARRMRPDGSYERIAPGRGEAPFSAQAHLLAVRGGSRR